MLNFNTDDIRALSNKSSFTKGKEYYKDGLVENITQNGNVFIGTVIGSDIYNVSIDVSDIEPEFECDCPYDYDGLCKHCVAFALAVLNADNSEKTAINLKNIHAEQKVFENIFENADTQIKLRFLKQILNKDSDLQNQFINYADSKKETSAQIAYENIDEIKKQVFTKLDSLDFDEIVEDYDPYIDGYYNDEGYIDEVENVIIDTFRPFLNKSISFFKKGNIPDGIRILLGIYEGIRILPDTEDSNYDLFPDSYNLTVSDYFKRELKMVFDALEKSVISENQADETLDLIFSRYASHAADGTDTNCYDLKIFEPVFMALINDEKSADKMFNEINKNKLDCKPSMSFVILKIADLKKDEKLWIETAEKFALTHDSIAKQLAEKYRVMNKRTDFIRISKKAFAQWPATFNLYLIDNLDVKTEKELYLKALSHYVTQKGSIKHYMILREYLSEAERNDFVDKQKAEYNYKFYIQLLETEKRYAEILEYATKKSNYFIDLPFVLNPIINIYPIECFNLLKRECDSAFRSTKRNRKTYQDMAELLSAMLKISSKHQEAITYILSFYNSKPNLPALKDEFRKYFNPGLLR